MKRPSPAQQLRHFMRPYASAIQTVARSARARLRAQLPGAVEIVYDNYNALVVGFSPTDRASDAICSIALYPRWVTLFFLDGAALPDPRGILTGSGKVVRHVVLESAADVDSPAVRALLRRARRRASVPFGRGPRRVVIKSISVKRRPRRPRGARGASEGKSGNEKYTRG
jgi:hypothetical protein